MTGDEYRFFVAQRRPGGGSRRRVRTIGSMTDEPVETPVDEPPAAPARAEKRNRRTMLSTGFSDVPGKTCQTCGFQGFRWQTECPEGHPLS